MDVLSVDIRMRKRDKSHAQIQLYLPYLNDSKHLTHDESRIRLEKATTVDKTAGRLVFFRVCSLIDRKHSDDLSKFLEPGFSQ
jgi:hypothetical protein